MKLQEISETTARDAAIETVKLFESVVGISGVDAFVEQVGPQTFLRIVVGRTAPIYDYALEEIRSRLPVDHPFSGLVRLSLSLPDRFPVSVEASALAILLTRATRPVSQGAKPTGFAVPYVPFQHQEDHKIAQPATQLIVGRRGVGKSTLILRAADLLSAGSDVLATLDCQAYARLSGEQLHKEVLIDLFREILSSAKTVLERNATSFPLSELEDTLALLETPSYQVASSAPSLRRVLSNLTKATSGQIYCFLDDFHLIDWEEQPSLLHLLHGVLKGANGWLKVTGLRSLLHWYEPTSRVGLQYPGDVQFLSLDLTLENPSAAESHLAAILNSFMNAIGYSSYGTVLPSQAFRRLVWANAGVPRDFLQMFARSLEHAKKAGSEVVSLGDVNVAIGELGQQKQDEMLHDARNENDQLQKGLDRLTDFCLSRRLVGKEYRKGVNAFLVKAVSSHERTLIGILADLRLLHVIHQSITPSKAGETYQAYILDYSLFTGSSRRMRNVVEMLPEEGEQFSFKTLRGLRKLPTGFFSGSKSSETTGAAVHRKTSRRPKRKSPSTRPRTVASAKAKRRSKVVTNRRPGRKTRKKVRSRK